MGSAMTTKKPRQGNDKKNPCDDIDYAHFCDGLEKQYQQAKEDGLFEVLRVLKLDKDHSDIHLAQAIDYFNEKGGAVEKDAPMDFLTECDKRMVSRDGAFRPALYCMLLSTHFAEAIEKRSVFLKHSFKYSFGG